ncbi:MAG: alpha/beta hydrolase [Actinomycetota bacterium]|nr:alpha/beta hydrolase [Actinomycetota bacterium]
MPATAQPQELCDRVRALDRPLWCGGVCGSPRGVTALGRRPPVAGGLDVDLPGAGVRLRATRWPGTGVPVLLLHGLAQTRRFWDLVVPDLVAAGLPVLALDQRGHGDSDRPAGPYDGDAVVRDVLTALDAVGLSRVVVVGHSWGATTALRLAATAPGRVLSVVAIDGGLAGPAGPDEDRAAARERLEPPQRALTPQELPAVLAAGPLRPWWSPEVEAALLPVFETGPDGLVRNRLPFAAHLAILDDLLDADLPALLPDVRCPAWLVVCEPPGAARVREVRALEHAQRVLPAARGMRWAAAEHDVPLQWPALVAGLVRTVAAEVAPRPGAAPRAAPPRAAPQGGARALAADGEGVR